MRPYHARKVFPLFVITKTTSVNIHIKFFFLFFSRLIDNERKQTNNVYLIFRNLKLYFCRLVDNECKPEHGSFYNLIVC